MTSFPHYLVLDSQPRFGLTQSEFLNLYNFLIDNRIFMKLFANCSAFASLSCQENVKVCNPIPLIRPNHSENVERDFLFLLKEIRI